MVQIVVNSCVSMLHIPTLSDKQMLRRYGSKPLSDKHFHASTEGDQGRILTHSHFTRAMLQTTLGKESIAQGQPTFCQTSPVEAVETRISWHLPVPRVHNELGTT